MPDMNQYIQPLDNVKTLLDAGAAHAGKAVIDHGGKPFVVVPGGYSVKELELPPAKIGTSREFSDVESFALYVSRFKQTGTLMFAAITDTNCAIVAHLDYHDKTVLPGANFKQEWETWIGHNGPKGNNGSPFSQVEFALFLEDNERLFRSPDAASLLDLVLTLQGKNNVRFNAAHRLQSGGAKLDYEEDVSLTGGTGTGAIEIPTELLCAIIPFENGPQPYEVRSRLRYRIHNRQIVFWYETVTPHLVLRDAAKAVMDAVREKLPGVPLMIGR